MITDQEIQRIKKNLPMHELVLFELLLSEYHAKSSKVEEMQKTLEWYADEANNIWKVDSFDEVIQSNVMVDEGERARQALKGTTHE